MPDIEIARLTDRLMRRIHASLNATASDFDRHDVGPAGGILLLTLGENEPARVQDLATLMARDKAQITRAVNALEAKGLIRRAPSPNDARATLLSLTPAGRTTVADIEGAVAAVLEEILAPLSAEDRAALKDILGRV